MAKITFSSLKLKYEPQVQKFYFNGDKEIEVVQYIDTDKKNDLISIALQKSEENGVYNLIQLDAYFHLYIVYMYTNITFTDKQKEDEMKLFDLIKETGLLKEIIDRIPEDEYDFLFDMLELQKDSILHYRNTAGAVLQSFINDLPKNAQAALDIVNNFDKDKFNQVVQFAQAANGNRDIQTNMPIQVVNTSNALKPGESIADASLLKMTTKPYQ